MYYTLDNNNYIKDFLIVEKLEYGNIYDGEIPSDFVLYASAYKIQDDKLVLDKEKFNNLQERFALEKEKNSILEWFSEYDIKVIKYTRYNHLNISNEIDIAKLDEEALLNQHRLEEIQEILDNLIGTNNT